MFKNVKSPGNLFIQSYLGDMAGVGTIRVIIPYLLLNNYKHKDISFTTSFNQFFISDPAHYKNTTFVQFQRSATEQHLKIIKFFKKYIQNSVKNKYTPIIYEIDDLLIDIPKWNIAHDYYKKNLKYIEEMLSIVDGISVSTQPLKEVYSKYNPKVSVIPNRLPKFIWGYPNEIKETNKVRIYWGGSSNHFSQPHLIKKGITGGDFNKDILNFIIKTRKVYQWVFTGSLPLELNEYKDDIEFHNWTSTLEYPLHLKSLNIDIGIAPLEDNLFNKCKSNIKMLEYCGAGFPGIYSNVFPYQNGRLTANNDKEMISHIELLANSIDERILTYNTDRNTIGNDLYWEDNNNLSKYIDSYLNLFDLQLP